MDTLAKITMVLEQQNKTQKDLCDFLGVSKNVFTAWKAGRNASYTKYLYAIATFLDVPVSYLIGDTDEIENPSEQDIESPMLDEDETEILDVLKRMSGEQRRQVLTYAYFVLSRK